MDPFAETLSQLVETQPGILAVMLADLDGEDIAVQPPSAKEALKLCAAYGGIGLRRLGTAGGLSGLKELEYLELRGSKGSFLSYLLAEEYQLVLSLGQGFSSTQMMPSIHRALRLLKEQL